MIAPATADIKVHSPDYSVTVTPTGALVRGDTTGALVLVVDPVDSLRDSAERRLGGEPGRPDGRAAADLRRPDRRGHRRALVGDRQRAPGDHGRLRHRRRPDVDRGARHPQRVHPVAAASSPDRPSARGPAHGAVRAVGRRRRGDHRGAGHAGPARGRAAGAGDVRGGHRHPPPGRAGPAARRPGRGLPGRRHRDDAGGLPAVRRGTRPAPAGPALHQRIRHQRRARRARCPGPRGEQRGARRHAPDLVPAARHLPGAVPRRVVRGHPAAVLRRVAVRPGPLRFPHRPRRPRHAGGHGQRPGHAGSPQGRPDGQAPGRARPADLLPRHRRRADRLHLRGPARLLLPGCRGDHGRPHRQGGRRAGDPARQARRRSRSVTATDDALADAILAWVKDDQPAAIAADQGRARQGHPRERPGRGRRPRAARGGAHRPGAAGPAPAVHRDHPPRPARPAHGHGPRRRARGRDAVPRDRGRALHAQVARHRSRAVRARTPRLRSRSAPAAGRLGTGGLGPDPRAQGRRHRLRLGRVPGRGRPLPRRTGSSRPGTARKP